MKNTIIFLLLLSFTSCSVVNKGSHKNKSTTDSTSVVHEKKDSTATIDTFTIRKSQIENENEIVIEFSQNDSLESDSAIYITPKNPNDYFEITKEGIKTNMPLKKVTVKGNAKIFNYDSLVGHSKIEESYLKDSDTHVTKKEKKVTQDVSKKKFLWLLLLLIPAYLIYRNWPKIKQLYFFIKTFFI